MKPEKIRSKILEIMRDPNLSDAERSRQRQQLMSGQWSTARQKEHPKGRPQGEVTPKDSDYVLANHADQVLAAAIRLARVGQERAPLSHDFKRVNNEDRPDEAFTTERAKRTGRANAASGRIMVNVPNDHFGPILPEHDPRGRGVLVGDWWKDRLDCRQWGAHLPHVAGIAGQSSVGAQSVVLSGGYEDDRDEGEWFLYTGSGGRDLSGNKRTNKVAKQEDRTVVVIVCAPDACCCDRVLPTSVTF
eukprot:evm.model.scf_226EXC.6 EVM.evm.TU.scf_226EXC.6   scf_226EXC:43512-46011(-)